MDHGKVIALGTPRELIASMGVEHVLEFSADRPVDPSELRAIDGVHSARAENGTYLLEVSEPHRAVTGLLSELGGRGIGLTELRIHSATLEDVFVSLTGRHLRDE
jgi:ABC-2 type transport system ATP-binding protein